MPAPWPDNHGLHLLVEAILLALRACEADAALDCVDEVDLALDQVRPRRSVRVLEVGHEHTRAGVERVDEHLAIRRTGDLYPPVLQVLRSRGDFPLGVANRARRDQELRGLPRIDPLLALVTQAQQLLPSVTELALQASHEGPGVGGQNPARPPLDRALDLDVRSGGHRLQSSRSLSAASGAEAQI